MEPEEIKLVKDELNDLLVLEEGLTDWEVEFIESVDKFMSEGGTPTKRQAFKVHELWDKKCG